VQSFDAVFADTVTQPEAQQVLPEMVHFPLTQQVLQSTQTQAFTQPEAQQVLPEMVHFPLTQQVLQSTQTQAFVADFGG